MVVSQSCLLVLYVTDCSANKHSVVKKKIKLLNYSPALIGFLNEDQPVLSRAGLCSDVHFMSSTCDYSTVSSCALFLSIC